MEIGKIFAGKNTTCFRSLCDKMYEEDSGVDTFEDDSEWANPFDEQPATSKSTIHNIPHASKYSKTSNLAEHDIPISKLKHARTIIHIDIDCFYAQVEMIRNPQLREQPIGIQQKYIVVTCNYKAREYGVTKLMSIKDAKDKCPQLILVNGEDLTHYREMSYKISEFLQKYMPCVERLGFDENFLDVSEMVQQRVHSGDHGDEVKGHIYQNTEDGEEGKSAVPCDCGCNMRLLIGSEIANDIRSSMYDELGITGCAGISYNKLLAKLVGEQHKPNQQTTLMADQTQVFMSSMKKARKIPGIGHTTANKLSRLGVVTVKDLQNVPVSDLVSDLGETQAFTIKQLSYGVDDSVVVPYGRPQTISDEDSFKKCSTVSEVRSKALQLITSLLKRIKDDGRIVQTIRLTIRKLNAENKWTKRESRQCPVPHHIALKITQGDVVLQELATLVMGLFKKLIDVTLPFHLTLMNVAFCNLTEKPKNSIQNFLSPKKSGNISNDNFLLSKNVCDSSDMKSKDNKKDRPGIMSFFKRQQEKDKQEISVKIKTETNRKRRQDEDFSQNESKKMKSEEQDTSSSMTNECCKESIDKDVFNQLPSDIQEEIVKTQSESLIPKSDMTVCEVLENSDSRLESDSTSDKMSNDNYENDDLKSKLTSAGINVDDFHTFPPDIQKDILEQYKISLKQNTPKQNKKSILNYFTAKQK